VVNSKSKLFPILLVNFIGTMGYSIVLPFLIIIVLRFGGDELIYGALGATYSFFQLIGAPILGRWSDKIGRRKVLLISQSGTFLAWLIFLIALIVGKNESWSTQKLLFLSLPLLLIFMARALDGITGGNVSVANAYLADITSEKDRNKNYGKMAASANLGFIAGPVLAGLLGATVFSEVLPVAAAMLISLIAIIVIKFQLIESNPCTISTPIDQTITRKIFGLEHKECHKMTGEGSLSFMEVMKRGPIASMIILYFLIFLAFNFFYVAFPIYASRDLSWTVLELGIFFSIMGGLMVLVQGPLLTKLSARYKDEQLIIAGSIMLFGSFIFYTGTSYLSIGIAVVLFAGGNGIMWPSFLSVLSKRAGDDQGVVQGFASSAGSLASIIGLIGGGLLFGILNANTFLLSAGVMFIITVYVTFISRKKVANAHE
jgi:DHA1 family tetracycline resistance protein-like MFS transporter